MSVLPCVWYWVVLCRGLIIPVSIANPIIRKSRGNAANKISFPLTPGCSAAELGTSGS